MGFMNIRARTTYTTSTFPKDNRPTLHKGDKGDVLALGRLERIQEGIWKSPPWS
jgi:hypothetical protein